MHHTVAEISNCIPLRQKNRVISAIIICVLAMMGFDGGENEIGMMVLMRHCGRFLSWTTKWPGAEIV
jgi:hypothetical protein